LDKNFVGLQYNLLVIKWETRGIFKNVNAMESCRGSSVKADSHIAFRAHAAPMPFPCRMLIHTCHAAPLSYSESAVSFVKFRVVAGNIRTANPTV
jgi:hypothetical protein